MTVQTVETHIETIILGFVNDADYCGWVKVTTVVTDSQLPGRGTDHAAVLADTIAELISWGWEQEDLMTKPGDSFVY